MTAQQPSSRATTGRSAPARIAVAVVATLATLLVVEGLLSLSGARTLRHRIAGGSPLGVLAPTGAGPSSAGPRDLPSGPRALPGDEARLREEADADDYLVPHLDPLVGYTLRPDTTITMKGHPVRTNALGMRARPGPPPPDDALRLVVLGDSVAFGDGLGDEHPLAAQIEELAALTRGPNERPLACWTVAVSGWNHRNAVQFLIDHFEHYDPDIVVYLPSSNDLNDTYGLWETGRRRIGYDPAAADSLLPTSIELLFSFHQRHAQRLDEAVPRLTMTEAMGPVALTSDLTPESRRRYDENADSIVRLADFLAVRGRRLVLAHYREQVRHTRYAWILRERLLDRAAGVPEVPLFRRARGSFGMIGNPHPNPDTVRVLATWCVEWLVERGWLSAGAGHPLPEVPDVYADARAPAFDAEDVREEAADERARRRDEVQPAIDLVAGRAFAQIYGGLNADGTLGTRMRLMLAAEGPELTLVLGAVPELDPHYPLEVAVAVDGQPLGRVTVPPSTTAESVRAAFPLPPGDDDRVVEVALHPERWSLLDTDGWSRLAACRLLSISAAD